MTIKELSKIAPWEWPNSAGRLIKEKLRDRNSGSAERMTAVALAGENVVTDDEMAELLVGIVESREESEALRPRAAIALGPLLAECDLEGFDEADPIAEPPVSEATFEKIHAALRRAHEDETEGQELRRRALEASVRSPQDWHPDAIRKAYASGDPEWKLTAVFAMGQMPGFDAEIVKELESEDPTLRREAVVAAGRAGIEKAWPQIEAILENERKNKDLLIAAIGASVGVNADAAQGMLIELADSRDKDIAAAANEALTWDGDDDFDDDEEEEVE